MILRIRHEHDAFDLIVTADTLVYFGALDDVAAAAAGALRTGGRFIFTVEEATAETTRLIASSLTAVLTTEFSM